VLILSRTPGEIVRVGTDIKITILDVDGSKVRIGFDAERHIIIDREEIYARKQAEAVIGLLPRKGFFRDAKT
jgi:carbon storage regulator